MHLSSILGAISTALLFNPHLALGAYLGSPSTTVSSNQHGTVPFFEVPLSKRADETSSAAPDQVDAALDRVVKKLGPDQVLRWVTYYLGKYPRISEEMNSDARSAESPPEIKVDELGYREWAADTFKYAFKYVWSKKTRSRPNPAPLTVADVEMFSQSLDKKGKYQGVYSGESLRTDKVKFISRMFQGLNDIVPSFYITYLPATIGDEKFFELVGVASGRKDVTKDNHLSIFNELTPDQKIKLSRGAFFFLLDQQVDELFELNRDDIGLNYDPEHPTEIAVYEDEETAKD